ncbi:MLO-like protein 1 [Linum perenne]
MVDYGEMALALTPTWAVGTVVTVMIAFGFFFQWLLKYFGKFLHRTKRKALLSALYKIKDSIFLLLGSQLSTGVLRFCVLFDGVFSFGGFYRADSIWPYFVADGSLARLGGQNLCQNHIFEQPFLLL